MSATRRNEPSVSISRRAFVRRLAGLSASAMGLAVLAACAPSLNTPKTTKVRRIGYLSGNSRATVQPNSENFQQGLHDLGHVEGRDFVIDVRIADTELDRRPWNAEVVRPVFGRRKAFGGCETRSGLTT